MSYPIQSAAIKEYYPFIKGITYEPFAIRTNRESRCCSDCRTHNGQTLDAEAYLTSHSLCKAWFRIDFDLPPSFCMIVYSISIVRHS